MNNLENITKMKGNKENKENTNLQGLIVGDLVVEDQTKVNLLELINKMILFRKILMILKNFK